MRPAGTGNTGNARSPTTDVVTYLLARVLGTFQIELDISTLSRLVGLVLIGSIIVVNLRASLVWVHRAFSRLGSGGLISTPFMLLILGQLMVRCHNLKISAQRHDTQLIGLFPCISGNVSLDLSHIFTVGEFEHAPG